MYSQIAQNKRRTLVLMTGFVGFVWLLGWVFGQAWNSPGLAAFVLSVALIYALVGYYFSAQVTLAIARAKPIAKADAPELYRVVENLSIAAGLPMPKVYIIDDTAPNAFATGRDPNHAVVAVTRGLLEILDKTELEGVIAHELSHVGNYDIRLMAVVVVFGTIVTVASHLFWRVSWFSDDDNRGSSGIFALVGVALAVLAPIAATILQLAVSRQREYLADASGALLTRYPEGLASALEKISTSKTVSTTASPAIAHLYISDPQKKSRGAFLANLFSTHPPINDRIRRLKDMEVKV